MRVSENHTAKHLWFGGSPSPIAQPGAELPKTQSLLTVPRRAALRKERLAEGRPGRRCPSDRTDLQLSSPPLALPS